MNWTPTHPHALPEPKEDRQAEWKHKIQNWHRHTTDFKLDIELGLSLWLLIPLHCDWVLIWPSASLLCCFFYLLKFELFFMSSSELELGIGLAQGLTGMLICHLIPRNWNWVLDWVLVHWNWSLLMSSSELELGIGLAQGLTGMLIFHLIPWNWNWILDWVSVHRACSSSLTWRRYPCIGIVHWIGPGLN